MFTQVLTLHILLFTHCELRHIVGSRMVSRTRKTSDSFPLGKFLYLCVYRCFFQWKQVEDEEILLVWDMNLLEEQKYEWLQFGKIVFIHQIHKTFPPPTILAIQYMYYGEQWSPSFIHTCMQSFLYKPWHIIIWIPYKIIF